MSLPPRKVQLELPTGRRVEVRVDLSVRVMLRSGLILASDEITLINAIGDVPMDDRGQARRLQDALVLHALDERDAGRLDGVAEPEFVELLQYALGRLTAQPDAAEDDDDADDVASVSGDDDTEATPEPTLDEALALMDSTPSTESTMPESAKVLEPAPEEGGEGGA